MKITLKLLTVGLLLLLFCFALASCSNNVTDENGFVYELNDDKTEYTVVGYTGTVASPVIPANYGGLSVTAIGKSAFSGKTVLTDITIPETVRLIDSIAFSGCTNLVSVKFDGTSALTELKSGCFSGCSKLNNVVLPNSVTTIGYKAFADCSGMTSAEFSSGLTLIDYYAFSGCTNLTNLTLKSSFTVRANAFAGCTSLRTLMTPATLTAEDRAKEYTYDNEHGLLTHGDSLIRFLLPSAIDYEIPANIKSVEPGAFFGQYNLKKITVEEGNTAYKKTTDGILYSIDGTKLIAYPAGRSTDGDDKTFTVPDGVTVIDKLAFCGTQNIHAIVLPDGLTTINEAAFEGCSLLRRLTVGGNGKITVAAGAFTGCKLFESYRIIDTTVAMSFENKQLLSADGTRFISYSNDLTLSEYTLPDTVTTVDSGAFMLNSSLQSIKVNDANTAFSAVDGVLYSKAKTILYAYPAGKTDTSFPTPAEVTSVADYAFAENKFLKTVTLSAETKRLSIGLFKNCTSLEKLVILASALDIDAYATDNCTALTTVEFAGTEGDWANTTRNAKPDGNEIIISIKPSKVG